VIIDMSFMSKFLVQGRDAGKILNFLSTANVNGPKDNIVYTQWLDDHGKMEADVTVMKLEEDKFIVVATDTMHRHVETLIRREIEDSEGHAFVADVTGSFAQMNIQGPKSRELMQLLTDTDMSDAAFPFRAAKKIAIGYAWVTCVRITYVGELGYELYVPAEHATHVYDRIMEVNEKHNVGLVHAGLRTLGSLRMEKAYRDYGHDMDNRDGIYSVGLGFTCDYEKEGGFKGKEAALLEKAQPATSRLLQILVLDPEPLMYHAEIVYRNDQVVGHVASASYGHTLGGAVGLAMVTAPEGVVNKQFLEEGKWEIEIAGKKYPAKASLRPLYDPNNKKIRC
jgi:4-methylaminobutanoate oxidase (formaldehyde-forming)